MRRFLLAPLALVAGCTLGPRHVETTLSQSPAVAPQTIASAAGLAQTVVPGAPTPPAWWTNFESPQLDALVAQALAANTDLASAEATLRQARAQARVVGAGASPQVDASYQYERAHVSNALSSPLADTNDTLYSLHTAQLSVTYPFDLFGAQRSRIRSARAVAEVAQDRLLAARTTVVANLVLAAIQHAALVDQVAAGQASVNSNRALVTLLQRRQQLGDIGQSDVGAQQTALANAEAALAPLRRQLAHQAGLLSTLTGHAPGSATLDLPTLAALHLPQTLPVALPARIVAGRPDVRAAEAAMRGAGADVHAAIAARLPSITLSGNAGGSSTRFTDMFASGNPFYTLIGGITQPIFHAGALKGAQRAAEAALEGTKAAYRGAVLQAFLDVDDALSGLRSDAEALDAAARADRAATQTLVFTRRQFELGGVGTLQLLNASAASAQTSSALVQARAARLTDTVALYQATGGGVAIPPSR